MTQQQTTQQAQQQSAVGGDAPIPELRLKNLTVNTVNFIMQTLDRNPLQASVMEVAALIGVIKQAANEALNPPPAAEPPVTTWKDRVLAEEADLRAKLDKLNAFQHTVTFGSLPVGERGDLIAQGAAMASYLTALQSRIKRFNGTPAETEEAANG